MIPKQIPNSVKNTPENNNKRPIANSPNFSTYYPCWRLGHFDIESKWGLSSLLGEFTFNYTTDLMSSVLVMMDEELNTALEQVNNNTFTNIHDFWSKIENLYNNSLPPKIIREIEEGLTRNVFFKKIYPKLKTYENNTWDEIRQYTHRGKGNANKSNNHFVSIDKLSKEAQERLNILGFSDRSEIYSLRLEGKIRIYGFRELNYMDIIWIDLNHEIYSM